MFMIFDTLGTEEGRIVIFGAFDTKIMQFVAWMFCALDIDSFVKRDDGTLDEIPFGSNKALIL
jgi:hypothetical protein